MVRSWLEHPAWPLEGISWFDKGVHQTGDRIALGIVHAYTTAELLEPARARRVVSLVRLSFAKPQAIIRDQDADPGVTNLLLSFLKAHESNPSTLEYISDTETFIATQLKRWPRK